MTQATPIRNMPPLDEHLTEILGRPNFACAHIAEVLRRSGMEIRRKSEHEQATVLHYFLGFYFEHGADWWTHAHQDLQSKIEAAAKGVGS